MAQTLTFGRNRASSTTLWRRFAGLFRRSNERLQTIRELHGLSDEMLRDIGVDRDNIESSVDAILANKESGPTPHGLNDVLLGQTSPRAGPASPTSACQPKRHLDSILARGPPPRRRNGDPWMQPGSSGFGPCRIGRASHWHNCPRRFIAWRISKGTPPAPSFGSSAMI